MSHAPYVVKVAVIPLPLVNSIKPVFAGCLQAVSIYSKINGESKCLQFMLLFIAVLIFSPRACFDPADAIVRPLYLCSLVLDTKGVAAAGIQKEVAFNPML